MPSADAALRVAIPLVESCDNECRFCAREGLAVREDPSVADIERALADAWDRGAREVTFVGGEPTSSSRLVESIERAHTIGYRAIGLQTHARRLADGATSDELARAGLTDVHASLHGADAATHDYHTGIVGSFEGARRGIESARARGLLVVVSTVLTRSNYRVLNDMPRLLATLGVAAWSVWVPRVAGRVANEPDHLVPRLAMALPHALQAIDGASKRRIPAWIAGAPLCLLGPFAARAVTDGPRAFGAVCEACPSRARCSGVDPWYLARFGGDELIARTAVQPADDHPALRRMFVGPGEIADASRSSEPFIASRRALPIAR